MPKLREYRLEVQRDRLLGLAHFATRAGLAEVARALEEAGERGVPLDDEIALIESFGRSLLKQRNLVGIAWDAWMKTRLEIRRELDAIDPQLPLASIRSTGEADVLSRNIAACLTAHEQSSTSPLRLHAALSALSQVEALLTDHVHKQLFEHFEEKQHRKAEEALIRFCRLEWAPDVAFSLTQVRNSWAHGRALIDGTSLKLYDRKSFRPVGVVTIEDSEHLIRAGQAAWLALQFDNVFLAACDIREHGKLPTTPMTSEEAERQLLEEDR